MICGPSEVETFYRTVTISLESSSERPGIKSSHYYWAYILGVALTIENLSPLTSAIVLLLSSHVHMSTQSHLLVRVRLKGL